MPAVAAHALFGQAVFPALPPELQDFLVPHTAYWTLGFQGPDLLFYHKPLSKNQISTFGGVLHSQSPATFFQNAPWDDPRQVAYLLGFACHYCLDRACHPLVNETSNFQSTPHRRIESAFDLYLLAHWNLPLKRSGFIPKLKDYAPIAMAYGLPHQTIIRSGHSFHRYTTLLDHPKLVHLAGNDDFSALCLPDDVADIHICTALETLFQEAIPKAVTLITKLYQWSEHGHPFPCCLSENFEGVLPQ